MNCSCNPGNSRDFSYYVKKNRADNVRNPKTGEMTRVKPKKLPVLNAEKN